LIQPAAFNIIIMLLRRHQRHRDVKRLLNKGDRAFDSVGDVLKFVITTISVNLFTPERSGKENARCIIFAHMYARQYVNMEGVICCKILV